MKKGTPIHREPPWKRITDSEAMSRQTRRPARQKKKPPRGELTETEKQTNRKLAQIRVKVEHELAGVKRSRIVKDVLRNTKDGVSDTVMEAACGLHNVRDGRRKRRPKT